MRRPLGFLTTLALLASTVACNLTSAAPTPVATAPGVSPAPTDTPLAPLPTESPTVAFSGVPVSFAGTSFVLPAGLAMGTANEIVPESSGPDLPVWEIAPAYTKFTLQGYPLQGEFFEAQVMVYPAQQFASMSDGAAATISSLQALLGSPGAPLPTAFPFLPPYNAAQVFTAQPQVVQFLNGSGIRYLTQYAQYPATANNHDLFYTFQGLTSDGAYYVTAMLPVNATFLAADSNPDSPVPPDGIPFHQGNPQEYYASVVEKLNATAPEAFTPSLSTLDALIQSFQVTGQQ